MQPMERTVHQAKLAAARLAAAASHRLAAAADAARGLWSRVQRHVQQRLQERRQEL